jgi:recombination protein RecA
MAIQTATKKQPKSGAKPKREKQPKRKKRLESPSDIIADYLAGMKGDKEVPGSIRVLNDVAYRKRVRGVLSTHSATLDAAIGRGGFPLSRIAILHGKEASGKTTIALHLCAEAQRRGGLAVYFDKEHKLDPDYAAKLGVDVSRLVMPSTRTLEGVIQYMKATIRRAREIRKKTKRIVPIVIVADSLNAMKAFETLETTTGKKRYPAEARIWSEELPDIAEDLSKEHVALVLISQVRKKMNVMFGSDEEIAGGNAPKFYASLIVYVTRVGTEKSGSETKVGSKIETECKKNQIAPPFRKARFVIYWNRGIDYEQSLVLQLEEMGLVKKLKQGHLAVGKIELGQGYAAAANTLRSRPKLRARLIELFYKRKGWELAA